MNLTKTRVPLLAVDVTPLTASGVLEQISTAVNRHRRLTVLAHNLHSVHLFHKNPEFRQRCTQAELVLVDGMPVLAALSLSKISRLRAPVSVIHRVGSTDWVLEAAQLDCVDRLMLLGGAQASNQAAVQIFSQQTPAEVTGIPGDPWNDEDLDDIAESIRQFDPQILLVGMGMPLQEEIAEHLRRVTVVPVIAAVGGALDQISGAQSLAPRWLGRIGFEWAWRLASDPRRLSRRYLVEPFHLAATLMRRKI